MPTLSAIATREYHVELGNSLPPPALPNLEYRERRFTTAIETFNALRPGDAYEARLAVRIVLAGAYAVENLREAGLRREDFAKMMRCQAQAASFMREERAAKRLLAQEQKVRLAVEAVAGAPPAQRVEPHAPPPQAEPQTPPPPVQPAAAAPQAAPVDAAPAPPQVQAAAAAPPPAAVPAPAVAPAVSAAAQAAPQPMAADTAPPPSPEAIAKAEAFMQENMVAAAQIRHDRGVTPQNKAYFHHVTLPTDPAVIDALVRGTGDLMTLLDEVGGEDLDEAA